MMLYGIWRFSVEFLRADDRGATIISFLTPSQLIAVLMVLGSIGLLFGERYIEKKLSLSDIDSAEENNTSKLNEVSDDEN